MADGSVKIGDDGRKKKGLGMVFASESDVTNNSVVSDKATSPMSLQPIWDMMFKIAPEPPVDLDQTTLNISGSYPAKRESTGTTDLCTDDTTPVLQTFDKFMDGDSGVLSCYVKNFGESDLLYVEQGTKTLSTSSDVSSSVWLNITEDSDPYAGVQGAGIYKQLRANITPTTAQAIGGYVAKMTHSITGSTPALTYWVDDPSLTVISGIDVTAPSMTSYVSGVKTLVAGQIINIDYSVSNAVNSHYNSTQVGIISSTGSWSVSNPSQNPATTPSDGDTLSFTDIQLVVKSSLLLYLESIQYSIQTYNSKTASASSGTQTIPGIRVDQVSVGTGRVVVGAIPSGYPSGYGGSYDNTQSLLSGDYVNELQLRNGLYIYPTVDYTSYGSPNYSTCTGTRGVMYKVSGFEGKAFTLSLSGGNTGTWTADGLSVTSGVTIYVKWGSTGWLDANESHFVGDPSSDGDACMVSGNSTAISKRCTFGTVFRTGDIYVYIALPQASTKTFSQNISIGSFA